MTCPQKAILTEFKFEVFGLFSSNKVELNGQFINQRSKILYLYQHVLAFWRYRMTMN